MAEVLGRRSLLGFGVLLAWLVLFHLLVNIWLLCVFTSLLVVLGGWLGSQAVLESNSLVHLERFISLNPVKGFGLSSLYSTSFFSALSPSLVFPVSFFLAPSKYSVIMGLPTSGSFYSTSHTFKIKCFV